MAYKAFPLYFAAQSKSFETVKRLLDAGASVNQRLSTGMLMSVISYREELVLL